MSENAPLRVLVCGGRDYLNTEAVWRALNALTRGRDVLIIHGAARGADSLAWGWGLIESKHRPLKFPAQWYVNGVLNRAAGVLRNAQMLREGRPDLVVAFPGGRGTADMRVKAHTAGIPVWEPMRP